MTKRRPKLLRHFLALTVLSSLVLALTPALVGTSFGSNPNQCRQQANGNKKSSIVQVTCLFTAETGDIKVTIEGNRVLSDNEINSIITVVEGDLEVLNVCKSTRESDIDDCLDIIVKDVVTVSGTFVNFELHSVCASLNAKGRSSCKS
ncbi:MAG: hypothetical protein M3N57_03270 [Actinomycetota bacterium]|nr:hypothetical protein [Actinomycetota bacterium]